MQASGIDDTKSEQRHLSRPKVVRLERITLGDVRDRDGLAERLFPLFCASFHGFSRESWQRRFLADDRARVGLFHGADGALLGTSVINVDLLETTTGQQAVMFAPVVSRLGARGVGAMAARFGLLEALRYRARDPRTPLAYAPLLANPASYRLVIGTAPRAYPTPDRPTPPHVLAMLPRFLERRGLAPANADGTLVHIAQRPTDRERLLRSRTLATDRLAQHFLQLAPQWDQGVVPLGWVPLDLPNVLGALARLGIARRRSMSA